MIKTLHFHCLEHRFYPCLGKLEVWPKKKKKKPETKNLEITKLCCCSFAKSCPPLYEPMDGNTLGFPVLHYLLEFA